MGFNRISLGVQSFSDPILESIGRTHRCADILDSISMIQQVYGNGNDGIVNYSIDLISGLPGVTTADWIETLQCATSLNPKPTHLSLYDLQIESGTVFGKWYEDSLVDDDDNDLHDDNDNVRSSETKDSNVIPPMKNEIHATEMQRSSKKRLSSGGLQLPSPDECSFCYKFASGYLRSKGYEHYEISSYALVVNSTLSNDDKESISRRSLRSRHNQIYWEVGGEWYGKCSLQCSCL